jgi:hypothetical protein
MTVKKSIKPLAEISANLASRTSADFSVLPSANLPSEIQPVVTSFNELLMR